MRHPLGSICLLALLSVGCIKANRVNPAMTADTPSPRWPAPAPECAVELPVSSPTGGLALWQGFDLAWTYNHRVNRLGSIIEPAAVAGPGGAAPDAAPCWSDGTTAASCPQHLTVAAASGTGPDTAAMRTYYSLVAAPDVGFATASTVVELRGAEYVVIEEETTVEVPLSVELAGADTHVAVLQGLDLGALGSADKLVHLSLQLGDVSIDGQTASVPLQVEARMACTTAECPKRDNVDYALRVGVAVIGGPDSALGVTDAHAERAYAWDKKEELPDLVGLGRLEADARWKDPAKTVALRGFSVTLEAENHMLAIGTSVHGGNGTDGVADLRFKQWTKGMPIVAFKEEGKAEWKGDAVVLTLAEGHAVPMVHRAAIQWPGFGASAIPGDPKADKFLPPPIPLQLRLVPEGSNDPTATCDAPALADLGYTLRDAGQARGELVTVRRDDGALSLPGTCPADATGAVDIADPAEARARAVELGAAADVLAAAAQAAMEAEGAAYPDGSVRVTDLGLGGLESGGLESGGSWIRRDEHVGTVVRVVDGWVVADGVETAVEGLLHLDEGAVVFEGTLVQRPAEEDATMDLAFSHGWEGTLRLEDSALTAQVDDLCGGTVAAELTFDAACTDGLAEAALRGGGTEAALAGEGEGCPEITPGG